MAAGDIAAAAGMAIYTGNENANQLWIRDNEILDQVATDRTATRSVARGGTGGTTQAEAAAALAVVPASDVIVSTSGVTIADKIPRYDSFGRIACGTPVADNQAAPKGYVDALIGSASWNGGTISGQLLIPNAYAATSSYTVCYINGDGRVSRGASALRFKKYVRDVDPLGMGKIFPQLVRYQHRSAAESRSDGIYHYGHIADWLAESDDLRPFVVYETEADGVTLARDSFGLPVPLSIDFIALLLSQTAQLNARAEIAEARLDDALERIERLERIVQGLADGKGL